MKYFLLFFVFPLLSATECGKKKKKPEVAVEQQPVTDTIPLCVQQLIDRAKQEDPPNPPIRVDEYRYGGKTVYLFTAGCCDFFNMLYDTACHPLCAPSGGITGRGDGKCTGFSGSATFVKNIWKNEKK